MPPAQLPKRPPVPAPDSIDFEVTDFDSARMALDEPPAGVKLLPKGGPDWQALRRPVDPQQVQLRPHALAWLRKLEPELRPRELIARFPRVANQIAEAWSDPVLCLRVLSALVVDQRGDRRGFPLSVAVELTTLHDHLYALARRQRT